MIRESCAGDCRAMVAMAERFHAAAIPDMPFSDRHAAMTFMTCLSSPRAKAFTLDLGGPCGALILRSMQFDLAPVTIVNEVVFWIDPEHRGRWWRPMISAGEEWARSIGGQWVGLSCFNDGRTEKIFRRAGYDPRQIVAIKRL